MAKKSARILYVGNSFTTRNDLPKMLSELAGAGSGVALAHEVIAAGGASLRRHWNTGRPQDVIAKGRWDHVVLQEQSTLPFKNTVRFHENVREFAPAVAEAGATLVLYLTWARANTPETQKTISDAYLDIGRETGATVIPAGVAWQEFLKKHDEPVLHDKDKSHPTVAGTFLAACCFYATLFGGDPVGLEIPSAALDAADRKKLAVVARRISSRKKK